VISSIYLLTLVTFSGISEVFADIMK